MNFFIISMLTVLFFLDETKFRPVLRINESKGANFMGIFCILLLSAGALSIIVVDRTRLSIAYSTFTHNIHSIWASNWLMNTSKKPFTL